MSDCGEDVSAYFSNRGSMKMPIQRVNVDFTIEMLRELDRVAAGLNISRQAVIKSYLRQALDQHRIAKNRAVNSDGAVAGADGVTTEQRQQGVAVHGRRRFEAGDFDQGGATSTSSTKAPDATPRA